MAETLAERVRWARERKGLDQGEVAEALGWTRTTISDWETGRTRRPKRDKVHALAQVLGVDTDWLMQGGLFHAISAPRPLESPLGSPDSPEALIQAAMTLLHQALARLQSPGVRPPTAAETHAAIQASQGRAPRFRSGGE